VQPTKIQNWKKSSGAGKKSIQRRARTAKDIGEEKAVK
jgi:hypothetical protein